MHCHSFERTARNLAHVIFINPDRHGVSESRESPWARAQRAVRTSLQIIADRGHLTSGPQTQKNRARGVTERRRSENGE